jgi:hypothetical protein
MTYVESHVRDRKPMVSSKMPSQGLQVGDRVKVPWGLDTMDGVVEDVYETGAGPRVVIRIPDPSTGESAETVTLPAEVVERASEGKPSPAGAWVAGARYERSVVQALQRLLPSVLGEGDFHASTWTEHRIDPDRRPDFLIEAGPRLLVVEAKTGGQEKHVTAEAIQQLQSYLTHLRTRQVTGLLVTDAELAPHARELVEGNPRLRAVRWRGARDDSRLAAAVALLLRGSMQEQD